MRDVLTNQVCSAVRYTKKTRGFGSVQLWGSYRIGSYTLRNCVAESPSLRNCDLLPWAIYVTAVSGRRRRHLTQQLDHDLQRDGSTEEALNALLTSADRR